MPKLGVLIKFCISWVKQVGLNLPGCFTPGYSILLCTNPFYFIFWLPGWSCQWYMLVSRTKPCKSKFKYFFLTKLRMALYNSYNFFDANYYSDNRSNSRANTCQHAGLFSWCQLDNKPIFWWFIIFFLIVLYVRRIVQISDLSTFDGKVLSYHGCDG